MKLIIDSGSYDAVLISDTGEEKKVDLRYYAFEIEELSSTIYMFSTMHEIFKEGDVFSFKENEEKAHKVSKYSNFESCIAGLCLLGGIPKYTVETTIKNVNDETKTTTLNSGGWFKSDLYNINDYEAIKELSGIIKKMIDADDYFSQKFTFECKDNLDILKATIFHFLISKGKVRNCKKCKRWFMTTFRNDAEYCDRKFEDTDYTCKDLNNNIEAKNRYNEDEVIKKKNSIATYYKRWYEGYYDEFLTKFKEINKDYRNGKITKDEIMEWLENNRASKVKKEGFWNGKTSKKKNT